MLPTYEDVENLKQLILLSYDNRTAQQILLDMLQPYITDLQNGIRNPQLIAKTLTIIQVYCEFNLPWQPQFTTCFTLLNSKALYRAFMQQVNTEFMHCKPTKLALSDLIQWVTCRKNPLLPTKQDVVQTVYQLCRTVPITHQTYHFEDGRRTYLLYWKNDQWHWQDCRKQLTWIII